MPILAESWYAGLVGVTIGCGLIALTFGLGWLFDSIKDWWNS